MQPRLITPIVPLLLAGCGAKAPVLEANIPPEVSYAKSGAAPEAIVPPLRLRCIAGKLFLQNQQVKEPAVSSYLDGLMKASSTGEIEVTFAPGTTFAQAIKSIDVLRSTQAKRIIVVGVKE